MAVVIIYSDFGAQENKLSYHKIKVIMLPVTGTQKKLKPPFIEHTASSQLALQQC